MITRRAALFGMAGAAVAAVSTAAYAVYGEPYRLVVTRYRLRPPGWPEGRPLRIVALADLHAGAPLMSMARIRAIVDTANTLSGDVMVLLGDYDGSRRLTRQHYRPAEVFDVLSRLAAPLGVFAILGNHDYWGTKQPRLDSGIGADHGIDDWRQAIREASFTLLENSTAKVATAGGAFWLAGTASMVAIPLGGGRYRGLDDLPKTLAGVSDDAPVILLAHEPDQFVDVPNRVSLTMSGHTHGGQVRLFGRSFVTPSQFGNRFAYGHVVEENRHLIVSGGLGASILPVRLGVPPEIVVIDIPA